MAARVEVTTRYAKAYAAASKKDKGRVLDEVVSVTGCPEGHEVELVVVAGGGHAWPGRPDLLPPEIAGRVNRDIDASEYVWEYFARQPARE